MKHQSVLQRLNTAFIILGLTLTGVGFAHSDDQKSDKTDKPDVVDRAKMRERLEELFIWRVSDHLNLTTEAEAKFKEEYKKLSEERTKVTQKTEQIVDKLSKEKTDKGKEKLLVEYEDSLKEANLQLRELERMKKIFDSKQLAEYVILKRDMFHKFRNVLTNDTSVAKNPAPKTQIKEPEVYQEK